MNNDSGSIYKRRECLDDNYFYKLFVFYKPLGSDIVLREQFSNRGYSNNSLRFGSPFFFAHFGEVDENH